MSAFFEEVRARYNDPASFIKTLRAKMALHGITQGKLAERSGFDPSIVSEWLGRRPKRRQPSMASMVFLDEALERLIRGD